MPLTGALPTRVVVSAGLEERRDVSLFTPEPGGSEEEQESAHRHQEPADRRSTALC